MLLTNRRQRGPLAPFRIFWGNAQLLDGEMLGESTTCGQEVWKIFPIFRKRSRTPHDVFDPTAAIVTFGFFLLLAQASRMLAFGTAVTVPVLW